ncbi:MAG TPA: ELWxxDGT repeat protein, partial [Candidatus Polarisedimenticolia bacterium]|nr:ELWxxDGT repeat protein [Candidatus Polarisedimenticolia bacterium]
MLENCSRRLLGRAVLILLAVPLPAWGAPLLVKDINPAINPPPDYPLDLVELNGILLFSATDATNGTELWKSDGTASGTAMVKNIFPGSGSSITQGQAYFTKSGTRLFFVADDGAHGEELWRSDGTAAGTVLVKDIHAGPVPLISPAFLTDVNGTLYFGVRDQAQVAWELWKSDGTTAGTVLVKGGFTQIPAGLTNFNGTLFFTSKDAAHGVELWKSDGTAAGTVLVKDINPGTPSSEPL